jgi:hypothetical protein
VAGFAAVVDGLAMEEFLSAPVRLPGNETARASRAADAVPHLIAAE